MPVFVRASRRAKAYTRSSIVRSRRLTSLINRVGRAKVRASGTHFNTLHRREERLSEALAKTLKVKKIKREAGYAFLNKHSHGGYNIF